MGYEILSRDIYLPRDLESIVKCVDWIVEGVTRVQFVLDYLVYFFFGDLLMLLDFNT